MNASAHLDAFFAAWMRHNAGEIASFYDEDAIMEDPTLAAPKIGRIAIERYYADMFATLEDPQHDLLDWAARAGRIWFEWTFASGGRTQTQASFHGVSIQTLRDGLIVRDAAFWVPREHAAA